jgi:predicted nucleic-acid-binding protein
MIAIDTNVLVRLLVNDDDVQSPRAAQLFASEDVFIAKSVLLETDWVLRFSYGLSRPNISAAFDKLLSAASVTIEDAGAIRTAVDAHAAGMDFADALHVASAAHGAKFVTFDKKLARQAARAKIGRPVAAI